MKEQDYQRKIVKHLEGLGAYTVKVITSSKKGVPDVIACYKGRFIGVEVKTPKTMNNTSDLQDYNLELIQEAGGHSVVASDPEQLNNIIEEIDNETV